ncbi:MAG TPA: hypothetical protein VL793_07045, partial [Patescibacteria group bacterium]|nr:hypothetical protein [Patescibacteria group bacterium]
DGKLYNGYPTDSVTAHGALELGIHELQDGVVSRGVLLDVPLARGVEFLEPGESIFVDDLERAESDGQVRVEPGDGPQQPALGRLRPGGDRRPGIAAGHERRPRVEPQPAFLLVRPVAGLTVLREDGPNIFNKINAATRRWRQTGGIGAGCTCRKGQANETGQREKQSAVKPGKAAAHRLENFTRHKG